MHTRKCSGGFKHKVVSLFKIKKKHQKLFHIKKRKKITKDRIIRNIWTLFETVEENTEREELEKKNILKD